MSDDHHSRGMTRRRVLSGSAALLSAAAVLPVFGAEANDSQRTHYDAVIIGGGLAGLTAARELGQAGLDVVVLEANLRLGGRAYARPFVGTTSLIDLGGHYLQPAFQPHMKAAIDRYHLELVSELPPVYRSLVDGQVIGMPAAIYGPDELGEFDRFYFQLMKAIERIDPSRPADMQRLGDLDISYAQFIDSLHLPPKLRFYIQDYCGFLTGASLDQASVLSGLWWYAIMGNRPSAWMSSSRFAGTTRQLVDALRREVRGDLRLGSPVSRVDQSEEGVEVSTVLGTKLTAAAAVVAAPLNTWHDIQFGWQLEDGKQAALRERHIGGGHEVYLRVRHVPAGIQLSSDTGIISSVSDFTAGAAANERIVLLLMRGTPEVPNFKQLVQSELRRFFPRAELLGIDEHDWTKDRYSQGTWMVYRPGQMTRFASALGRREGRVCFAGADTATFWFGNMEGALETGERAAREVREIIAHGKVT